jgi:hypothetical protein
VQFFNGPLEQVLAKGGVPLVQTKLTEFFTAYLTGLKLDQVDLFSSFEGRHVTPTSHPRHTHTTETRAW